MKEEYVIKLTETEAKAFCHGLGASCNSRNTFGEVYYELIDLLYNHIDEYRGEREYKSGEITFTRRIHHYER
jgi:hypothetical protein